MHAYIHMYSYVASWPQNRMHSFDLNYIQRENSQLDTHLSIPIVVTNAMQSFVLTYQSVHHLFDEIQTSV